MIDQLINEINFNPVDPFALKTDLFSNKAKNLISEYDQFLENFYRAWLIWTFSGEFHSTIVYPGIIDGIKNKKYEKYLSDLSVTEQEQLCEYFTKIANEETEHTDIFLSLIKKIYVNSDIEEISDDSLELSRKDAQNRVENTDLIELLFLYYIGECYLWTCFYQIYKKTSDSGIRDIFKKILVDEAQHNNNHYKLLKKIKNRITTDASCYIEWCRVMRYFGLDFVKKQFNLNNDRIKKDYYFIKIIYDSPWHKEFNQLVIKKWYQLFEILYPNISLDEFTIMINR